jgi:hypothetical protein
MSPRCSGASLSIQMSHTHVYISLCITTSGYRYTSPMHQPRQTRRRVHNDPRVEIYLLRLNWSRLKHCRPSPKRAGAHLKRSVSADLPCAALTVRVSCSWPDPLLFWRLSIGLPVPLPSISRTLQIHRAERLSQRMPAFQFVLFLITLVALSRRGAAWFRGAVVSTVLSAITGASVSSPALDIEEGGASIRPIGLPLLGGLWVLLILMLTPSRYASLEAPQGLLFTGASLAVAFGYLYWIWKTTKALERQYPYQPPFNLLALRVFGSPRLSDFLDLTSSWQWIGTRQMLDGPDTVGHKPRDLINYFSGRLGDSIVEDTAELHEALREFRTKPDRQLRFPVNSMQCSDASWKEALQSLLDAADVVVMDLSSLSEKNRGIAYELGKVLDRIALRRIVLLVDDSTDLELLKEILAHEWEDMAPDSPNRGVAERTLRLYHVGGPLKRMPGESLYDWRRRLRAQIDEKGLVCLLYDAA